MSRLLFLMPNFINHVSDSSQDGSSPTRQFGKHYLQHLAPTATMSVSDCCLKGFAWDGTPMGRVAKLAINDAYVTGSNSRVAILVIHDLFGWIFPNIRLLADHYATEIGATAFVPDFFGGEVLPTETILSGDWSSLDLPNYLTRNSREVREPEIFACAKALREQGFEKVGAIGFCYGGWAVFRLAGAKEKLVDCVTAGHPSMLTKEDVEGVRADVAVQVLAPEIDMMYTDEMKTHTFVTLQKLGVPFDYQHYPKVEHACFSRGDEKKEGEKAALVRGKNAAVAWAKYWLHEA